MLGVFFFQRQGTHLQVDLATKHQLVTSKSWVEGQLAGDPPGPESWLYSLLLSRFPPRG